MLYQRTTNRFSHTALLVLGLVSTLFAHPIVPGLEASKISAELKGRVLIEEMNCVACHGSDSSFAKSSKKAPRLVDIGSRVNPSYLKSFILDPHGVKPGTTMPDTMAGMDDEEKGEVAEALTHFLLSQKKNDFALKVPDLVSANKGEKLFHSRGCVSCHSPRDAGGKETMVKSSAPLGDLAKKYSHKSLVTFLKDPHAVRPSGRMPRLDLPGGEVESIAEYLLRDTKVPGHLSYTLYRGKVWEGLGSDGVDAIRGGQIADFDQSRVGVKRGDYAVDYEGWIHILNSGEHTFYMEFNGGKFVLDGESLFDVSPSQRKRPRKFEKTVNLDAGWKKLKFTYYKTGPGAKLSLEWSGPKFKRGAIASAKLKVSDKPVVAFKRFEYDKGLAVSGRKHFAALGCASCHDDVEVDSGDYTPFSDLVGGKGCISKPVKLVGGRVKHPEFGFSDMQRDLISKALKPIEQKKLTSHEDIHKTLVSFNCVACHQRDGVGEISAERMDLFTGTHPELGDQGRLPPTLSHVGAKLKPEWLNKVLLEGKRQRPYMNVVMPHYGGENIGHLTKLFGEVDRLESVKLPKIESIKESKNAGYHMIGPKGFSCVACHNFNGDNSSGAGALDLAHITKSLKKNWFHLFMKNPSRFHATGIMPSFWPGGKSIRPDVLEGKPDLQIEALWAYLEDGVRAKKPEGLSRQSNDVRVFDKAEIVRGRGTVGFRGIGVGYPERINLAFDSEEMALRLLWKNEFASINHGSFRAKGGSRIAFPPGIPFYKMKTLDDNWPYKSKTSYAFPHNLGYQFRGYRLDDKQRPTFQYMYGEVAIDDFFEDMVKDGKGAIFKRTFSFQSPKAQDLFHFRVGVSDAIKKLSDDFYQVGGLKVRITSDHKGLIREGSPGDLLIPLRLPKGKSELTLEYQW